MKMTEREWLCDRNLVEMLHHLRPGLRQIEGPGVVTPCVMRSHWIERYPSHQPALLRWFGEAIVFPYDLQQNSKSAGRYLTTVREVVVPHTQNEGVGALFRLGTENNDYSTTIPAVRAAAYLREVAGNPFRWGFTYLDDTYRTPDVLQAARAAGTSQKPGEMELSRDALGPLLDALEEVGVVAGRNSKGHPDFRAHLLGHLKGVEWVPCKVCHGNFFIGGWIQQGLETCPHCKFGWDWQPLRSSHLRGCWALQAILRGEAEQLWNKK